MTMEPNTARDLLRHTLATISYRGGKTLRDTAADFPQFRAGENTRTPLEILAHIAQQLFQGAIADALTHVGQLAMLRGLAGNPIRGENYFAAEIVTGRVGAEQSAPRFEF